MESSRNVRTKGWTGDDIAEIFKRIVEERYQEIGQIVRRLRREHGYSQEALAAAAGLSAKTVTRIERGRHELRGATARKLADVLEIPVRELLEPLSRGSTPDADGPAASADRRRLPGEQSAPRPERDDQAQSA